MDYMRIRTIKPQFFLNEDLADLEQEHQLPVRIIFIGLWCCADREGRFEWRPRKLKAQIVPYDNLSDDEFSRVLDALTTRGVVSRYTVRTREIGVINNFGKHQIINNREQASILPDQSLADACSTGRHAVKEERKGKEEVRKEKVTKVTQKKVKKNYVYSAEFEAFWRAWSATGKSRNKFKASQEFKNLGSDRPPLEKLTADISNRLANDERWRNGFICDPERYLKHRRWEDSLTDTTGSNGNGKRKNQLEEVREHQARKKAAQADDSGSAGGGDSWSGNTFEGDFLSG